MMPFNLSESGHTPSDEHKADEHDSPYEFGENCKWCIPTNLCRILSRGEREFNVIQGSQVRAQESSAKK